MIVAFKRLGFLASIASLTVLSACAAVPLEKWDQFYVSNIPSSGLIHRANYDLTFALTFTNKTTNNGQDNFSAFSGTGWLIDWKGSGGGVKWTLSGLFSHQLTCRSRFKKPTGLRSL
ncbi:DUF31 family putative serine protease [Mycoplasmoides pneumoniae]|uniref:DUF31 family putative serine protease n=1 Tax=Mycoplasmoides pneumoniae TaxID=2104 RepID=UPI0035BBAAD0